MSLEDGREGENSVSTARSKLQKLQCLADLTQRSLQSARSSPSANPELKHSQIRMQEVSARCCYPIRSPLLQHAHAIQSCIRFLAVL